MNKTTKKIIISTFSILGIGIILYVGSIGYMMYTFTSGCGLDDGPFNAVIISPNQISKNSRNFELKNNGVLILDNRTDSLSPTLTLKENGMVKWTLALTQEIPRATNPHEFGK